MYVPGTPELTCLAHSRHCVGKIKGTTQQTKVEANFVPKKVEANSS